MAKKYIKRKKKNNKKNIFASIVIAVLAVLSYYHYSKQEVSDNNYNSLNGLSGATLKTALHKKIRYHQYLDFDENITARYWWQNYFIKTDWHPKGYFWDMYSTNKNKNYINGNIQNREHLMPRSWWGYRKNYSSFDANGDLHNLYPADNPANTAKSNLGLGEVGIAIFDNGVSKVGKNTYPNGFRGDVYEPADEYKGDFARTYFYMVTCYEDYSELWKKDATKSMLKKGTYPSFQPWAIEMLLKWHRQDPVSDKEIRRNNAVYKIQGNRNPFIDHPELAEYIWGNKQNEIYQQSEAKIKLNNLSSVIEQIRSFINYFSFNL